MQNLKKSLFFVSKMTRIWWIFIQALKSLKNLHFHWSLLCKAYNLWPKKVQRSNISWHSRVIQNLKKNWLVVWKMTWGIWQIFIRTLESGKIGIFNGILLFNVENAWATTYRGVTSMTLKNVEKSEKELTYGFKIDIKNLTTFNSRTWKSQKFTLQWLLLTKAYNVWPKKVQRSYISWH